MTLLEAGTVTLNVLSDDQLAALEERIVERVAAIVADHWLPRRPMTPDEFAEYCHVSTETVRRWRVSGELTCFQLGHVILIRPSDVAAFMLRDEREAA